MIAPHRAKFALSFALAAFIVGRSRGRIVSGKKLLVTDGHDLSEQHFLSLRKIIKLVGKIAAVL